MWIKLKNGALVNPDNLAAIEPFDRKAKNGEDVYCIRYFGAGVEITEEFSGEISRNVRIALLKEGLKIE